MRTTEAKALRRVRETLGMSQRELANELGVAQGAIEFWENGKRKIPGPVQKLLSLYRRELGEESSAWEHDLAIAPSSLGTARRRMSAGLTLLAMAFDRAPVAKGPVARRVQRAMHRRVVRELGQLKGLTMKFGQLVGYMEPLATDELQPLFASLCQQSPSIRESAVRRVIREALGDDPEKVFATWEQKPHAAGSISQLHRATLATGEEVIAKVRYPGIVEIVRREIEDMRAIEKLTERLYPAFGGDVFAELGRRFVGETDLLTEHDSLMLLREHFAHRSDMVIPRAHRRYSAPSVLTMDFVPSQTFDAFVESASDEQKQRAATTIFDFFYESVFHHGILHADPHPGNIAFRNDAVVFF